MKKGIFMLAGLVLILLITSCGSGEDVAGNRGGSASGGDNSALDRLSQQDGILETSQNDDSDPEESFDIPGGNSVSGVINGNNFQMVSGFVEVLSFLDEQFSILYLANSNYDNILEIDNNQISGVAIYLDGSFSTGRHTSDNFEGFFYHVPTETEVVISEGYIDVSAITSSNITGYINVSGSGRNSVAGNFTIPIINENFSD